MKKDLTKNKNKTLNNTINSFINSGQCSQHNTETSDIVTQDTTESYDRQSL